MTFDDGAHPPLWASLERRIEMEKIVKSVDSGGLQLSLRLGGLTAGRQEQNTEEC